MALKYYLIAPMGESTSDKRNRFRFVEHLLASALPKASKGKNPTDGLLSIDVLQKLVFEFVNADLIFADITNNNPNVFFELGIAICLGKPFQLLASQRQIDTPLGIPFDTQNFGIIPLPNTLDSYDDDVVKLKRDELEAIEAIRLASKKFQNWPRHHISVFVEQEIQKRPNRDTERAQQIIDNLTKQLENRAEEIARMEETVKILRNSEDTSRVINSEGFSSDEALKMAKELLREKEFLKAERLFLQVLNVCPHADRASIYLELSTCAFDDDRILDSWNYNENALLLDDGFDEARDRRDVLLFELSESEKEELGLVERHDN